MRSGLSSRAGDRGLLQSSTDLGSTLSFLGKARGDLERGRYSLAGAARGEGSLRSGEKRRRGGLAALDGG